MSAKSVVICASCALSETPPEKMLFCPECGTQRSRLDVGPCVECRRRRDAQVNLETWGPDYKEVLRQMREEYDRMTAQAWEEAE